MTLSYDEIASEIKVQWPNMPNSDIDKCIVAIKEVSAQFEAPVSALVHRNSYLAVEGEGLKFRLAYVHLGYVRLRNSEASDRYREMPLVNYHKKPQLHRLAKTTVRKCPECFSDLPTSGAPCWCAE